jgi:hypothetical protein
VKVSYSIAHHRVTELTEDAQRRKLRALPFILINWDLTVP